MNLRAIFQKPVDRKIEGVIKADDESGLRQEVEEYVLTNEVAKRLESFLDAYNNYAGANGVWISGFFGSGKSHLLKMLALLLENRTLDDATMLDLFLPKCGDNEILRGDLKQAVTIPSRSILFNIDQKADVISKTQIDALLSVFVKVFDEMCGYYGKQGHIAQFERDLDRRGLYANFQQAYQTVSGRAWSKGREQALLEGRNIAKAYASVTGEAEASALGILDKYRSEYRVSIEDFANHVKQYIDQQGRSFRLNFFVDEVGQYIADNTKLMTNLQTIAESLATKCGGRAWILVTAQEEMNSVVGEMSRQKGDDFTKIQARFANRMKLTSADVAEVIQKRLLHKNEAGLRLLSELYHQQSNNFKMLFDFGDGSLSYRNFRDRDHFIQSYPFVPYQFGLFQSAIQNLSDHNAFEGKHSSVGERSMLGVFQQVAIRIGDHPIAQLATFDLMFEGIRTALKASVQRSIQVAERNLDDAFAVRLLKTLLLVKYVKEFKATVRNLCVLMLDGFNQDLPALRKRVEEALALLEQQTYIQRNGEQYEYLTDEEKDVEQEIKHTEVEAADVANQLEEIIFDRVLKQPRIRYEENKQDYRYARKLDDKLHGKDYELAIHIISPFHEHSDNLQLLQMQNMGRDELLVVLPPDDRLVRDLLMYKRTEKYIKQNISLTQQETIKRILNDKGLQNGERLKEIQSRAMLLLGRARLFVGGSEIEIGGQDAQNRIVQGFYSLIARAYPNLRMLKGVSYNEEQVGLMLQQQEGLFNNDALALSEAEQELLAFIQNNKRSGVRTTLSRLLERFEHKPYGWYYAAILCTLAKLCARDKVEVRVNSNVQEGEALEQALRNSRQHANVVLEPQIEFTQSQIRNLKRFFEEFFDAPTLASEAKALSKESAEAFKKLLAELTTLEKQSRQFPFLSALKPVIEQLGQCSDQPYDWYFNQLLTQQEALLDAKEQVIAPIRTFMSGSQRTIFEEARNLLQQQEANFPYVESAELAQIQSALANSNCYRGNTMQQVKGWHDVLQNKVAAQLQAEIESAKAQVAALRTHITAQPEYATLASEQQAQIAGAFTEFLNFIDQQRLIALIRDRVRNFEEKRYPQLLKLTQKAPEPAVAVTPGLVYPLSENGHQPPRTIVESKGSTPIVLLRTLRLDFAKPVLANVDDVEAYIASLKTALLAEIKGGKQIQL